MYVNKFDPSPEILFNVALKRGGKEKQPFRMQKLSWEVLLFGRYFD